MIRVASQALVLGLLFTGCSTSGSDPTPETPSSDGGDGGSSTAVWEAAAAVPPFVATLPDEAANPVVAGDRVVVLGVDEVSAYDIETGVPSWTVQLPSPVCAGSRTVNADGVMSVLLGAEGECAEAAALDTTTGTVLWTVPIPRAADAFGHETAVSASTVVVGGECEGFSLLRLSDGSTLDTVAGTTPSGICSSMASDGTSVVLLTERLKLEVRDAETGAISETWPAEGRGRVGDVLTQDPLVVTARFASGGQLIDLSGESPRSFGRSGGGFGGEVEASTRVGDVVWVQYDDADELVGYDLSTRQEAGAVPLGSGGRLLGQHDGSLVLTTQAAGSDDVELQLVDPAAPGDPDVVAVLPPGTADDQGTVDSVIAGDRLVRLWRVGQSASRLDAFALPESSSSPLPAASTPLN